MQRGILAAAIALVAIAPVHAAIQTKTVEYTHDGVTMKGLLAWDDAATGKRPGVLVIHEFWGLNDYAKERAKQLAKMGYVAFAADMYGDAKLVDNPKDAAMLAKGVRDNPTSWVGRGNAALKVLQDDPKVDATKLAAMGYCFGGSTALKLAYSGAPLSAAVGFHAALPKIDAETAKNIKGRILICHGADDVFIPEDDIKNTKAALDAAKVNYKFIAYPNAVHSFTVKGAEDRMIKNVAYQKAADEQSWAEMTALYNETLKAK